MRKTALSLTLLATAVVCALLGEPAQAQPTRVFVAAQGSDTNPCTFAQPCRSFQKAHNTVAAFGEVYAVDPAGYGPVDITKSINIIGAAPGVGITAPANGHGISVQTGPSDRVRLRGLTIEGNRLAYSGIVVGSVGSLMIEDSVINGFLIYGVVFNPTTEAASKASETGLVMTNTVVSGAYSDTDAGGGIHIQPCGSGQVRAALHRVNVSNNYSGIFVESFAYHYANLIVAVTDSVVAGNQTGIFGRNTSSSYGPVHILVTGTLLSHNGSAVHSDGQNGGLSYIRLGRSTLSGNYYNSTTNGSGHILSAGDNYSDDGVVYPESFSKN